jgi:hypothetical protein
MADLELGGSSLEGSTERGGKGADAPTLVSLAARDSGPDARPHMH